MPKPPKTKKAIASVIQKKKLGLNRRAALGAAMAAGAVMAGPQTMPLFLFTPRREVKKRREADVPPSRLRGLGAFA
jgi:hypothetical protein